VSTKVSYSRRFEKQLEKCPENIQQKTIVWIGAIEKHGLREVRKRPSYLDEPLKGQRQGQRSIRLSRSYRLIYEELDKEIHVQLLEVNKHEY
jgi:proteic killer suppression protein